MLSRNSTLILSALFATLLSASSYTAIAADPAPEVPATEGAPAAKPEPTKKLTLAQQWEAKVKASKEESDKKVAMEKGKSMADADTFRKKDSDFVMPKATSEEKLAASQKAAEERKKAPRVEKKYKPYEFKKPAPTAKDTRSPQEQWKARKAEAAKAAEAKKAHAATVADAKKADDVKAAEAKKVEAAEVAENKKHEAAAVADAKKAEAAVAAEKAKAAAVSQHHQAPKATAPVEEVDPHAEKILKQSPHVASHKAASTATSEPKTAPVAPIRPGSKLHGPEAAKQREALLARGKKDELKKFHAMEKEENEKMTAGTAEPSVKTPEPKTAVVHEHIETTLTMPEKGAPKVAEKAHAEPVKETGDEPMKRSTTPPPALKGDPKLMKSDASTEPTEKPKLSFLDQIKARGETPAATESK